MSNNANTPAPAPATKLTLEKIAAMRPGSNSPINAPIVVSYDHDKNPFGFAQFSSLEEAKKSFIGHLKWGNKTIAVCIQDGSAPPMFMVKRGYDEKWRITCEVEPEWTQSPEYFHEFAQAAIDFLEERNSGPTLDELLGWEG
jgi:hypothetical protein